MQFGIAPGEQHPAAPLRERFIGQGTPGDGFESHRLQQLGGFWVAEMECGIAGDGDRQPR